MRSRCDDFEKVANEATAFDAETNLEPCKSHEIPPAASCAEVTKVRRLGEAKKYVNEEHVTR